ncbi:MAG: VanW family protein [Clostridium sp.]|nr:VanW family protein [Clostridium sp.]
MKNGSRRGTRVSNNKSAKKSGIIVLIAALAILLAGAAAYYLSVKGTIKDWNDKIYPGVTVHNIDIGGMTKEEAETKLKSEFMGAISDKKLDIQIQDKNFQLVYADITPSYDLDYTVNEAYNFGKEYGIIKKYAAIKGKEETDIELKFSYDEEKLKEFETNLIDEVNESPKNASLSISGDKISVQPEVDGLSIDEDDLDSKLKEAIDGDIQSEKTVVIEPVVTKAEITSEDLSKITGVIGSFSTSYGTSAAGRSSNIELATRKINGTIVMPGETFSFNDVVGPRTEEVGFKEAGTYVGNKVEPGIGGGICQVSTTLYRAVMRANIRSKERTNHSMAVGYASPGLDATVAYGYLDYKFTNTYDFPIYIQGMTGGKVVTYQIYGNKSALGGKTYDMSSDILETLPPETKVIEDNTLDQGTEVNEGGGMTGYKTIAYQITYENGVEVNREIVSRDTYAKVDVTIKKGTKPVVPADGTTPPAEGSDTTANPPADGGAAGPVDAANPQVSSVLPN